METFRQKFMHQIMLETFNYLKTARNESNIILKTYGSPVTQWYRKSSNEFKQIN